MSPAGGCYQSAAQWMIDHARHLEKAGSEPRLVHGMAVGTGSVQGQKFGHAWIEIQGDMVVDTERNLIFRSETYYRLGQISSVTRYTLEQMLVLILREEHYGPWRG